MIFRSPQSIRSTSQLSEYSNGRGPHHDDDRLMSPEDDDDDEHSEENSDGSERSMSSPRGQIPPPHPQYLRPFSECNNKNSPNHHHLA